jgi:hypothetical protein
LCEIILALVSNGEKVCIISNEMDDVPYMLNFLSFLAYRKFRYPYLTRTKLQTGDLSNEDNEMLEKVRVYFNENFAKEIVYIHYQTLRTLIFHCCSTSQDSV